MQEEPTCTMYPLAPLMRHPRPDTMPQEMMRALSQVEEPKKRRHWLEGICMVTQAPVTNSLLSGRSQTGGLQQHHGSNVHEACL